MSVSPPGWERRIKLKCPTCKSDKFEPYGGDPLLMECEDCHSTYSVPWAIGYWQGYLEGERETHDLYLKDLEKENEPLSNP